LVEIMLRAAIAFSVFQLGLGAGNNEATCIKNTGGTCVTSSCAAWRGNTECTGSYKCFCAAGTCAGTDQACHTSAHVDVPYTRIASGAQNVYEIQNARWPNYFIYVQNVGSLKISTDHDGETSDFYIQQPPSDGGDPNARGNPKSYMVLSKKWPTSAVYSLGESKGQPKPTCQYVSGATGSLLGNPPITELALTFTKAPADQQLAEMTAKNQTMVMLSTRKFPRDFFYVSSVGWSVGTYTDDPGPAGYWYIKTLTSVPLPMAVQREMFTYTGTRCSMLCGSASAKAHSTRTLSLAAVAAVVMAVAVSAMPASA